MKQIAERALDAATRRGVSYADVGVVEHRDRHVSTKNGTMGTVSASESSGAGVRVVAGGCWGFAATDDLSREGIERAAGAALREREYAIRLARAGA